MYSYLFELERLLFPCYAQVSLSGAFRLNISSCMSSIFETKICVQWFSAQIVEMHHSTQVRPDLNIAW